MTNTILKTTRRGLLLLAFSFLLGGNAYGQSCAVPPSCESMGFTLTADKCTGRTMLKCPFDNNKVYCPSSLEDKSGGYIDGKFFKDNTECGRVAGLKFAIAELDPTAPRPPGSCLNSPFISSGSERWNGFFTKTTANGCTEFAQAAGCSTGATPQGSRAIACQTKADFTRWLSQAGSGATQPPKFTIYSAVRNGSHEEARTYCASLKTCGLNWRLPSEQRELNRGPNGVFLHESTSSTISCARKTGLYGSDDEFIKNPPSSSGFDLYYPTCVMSTKSDATCYANKIGRSICYNGVTQEYSCPQTTPCCISSSASSTAELCTTAEQTLYINNKMKGDYVCVAEMIW